MNLIVWGYDGQDSSKSVVRSICFHNKLSIKNIVREDRDRSEYIQVFIDKSIMKVDKFKKRLNIIDFS